MMKFMKKSKQGVTLVESVFAVVILGILTIGILSLLTAGGAKIIKISQEADVYSQASQKLDLVIAAISNGYGKVEESGEGEFSLDLSVSGEAGATTETIDLTGVTIVATADTHGDNTLRGWYLDLTYKGVTLHGFASETEGVFD